MSYTEFTYLCKDLLDISSNEKIVELADVKLTAVAQVIPDNYKTILSLESNLVAYALAEKGYQVDICGEKLLHHVNFNYITRPSMKYDLVLGMDQATTFATTNQEQQDYIAFVAGVTAKTFVTTVMDYKNKHVSFNMFEEPFYVKAGNNERIVLNHRKWLKDDRQAWQHHVYVTDENNETVMYGPFPRRTMYFKQLARFLYDNDAKKYTVHKEPLYKGVFSSSFQHIVTAEF